MSRLATQALDAKARELGLLGEAIRDRREQAGLTQVALASRLKMSVAYLSLIERGQRNPPYTTVAAIARALGLAPAEVVPTER